MPSPSRVSSPPQFHCRWPAPPTRPELAVGEAHLWCASLDLPEAMLPRLAALLSPDEREAPTAFARGRCATASSPVGRSCGRSCRLSCRRSGRKKPGPVVRLCRAGQAAAGRALGQRRTPVQPLPLARPGGGRRGRRAGRGRRHRAASPRRTHRRPRRPLLLRRGAAAVGGAAGGGAAAGLLSRLDLQGGVVEGDGGGAFLPLGAGVRLARSATAAAVVVDSRRRGEGRGDGRSRVWSRPPDASPPWPSRRTAKSLSGDGMQKDENAVQSRWPSLFPRARRADLRRQHEQDDPRRRPLHRSGHGAPLLAKGCLRQNQVVAMGGPYRFVRHPFYLANALIDAGVAVMSGWWVIQVVLPFWWLAIYIPVMRKEEDYLTGAFGEAYAEYKKRIPRLIPWRRPLPPGGEGFRWSNPNIASGDEVARCCGCWVILCCFSSSCIFATRAFPGLAQSLGISWRWPCLHCCMDLRGDSIQENQDRRPKHRRSPPPNP